MPGQLFTQYFLTDGIKATPEWNRSVAEPEAFSALHEAAGQRLGEFSDATHLHEATTEQELVRPLLEVLGWRDYLPQQGSSGNEDIPDHLLFADADAKARAITQHNPHARFRNALVVQESKRLGLPLDVRDTGDRASPQHTARPDPALSGDRPRSFWRPHSLGHAYQRYRLAALRLPPGHAQAATTRPTCVIWCSRAARTTCGSFISCFAARHSHLPKPPRPFSKMPWQKAGGTKSR